MADNNNNNVLVDLEITATVVALTGFLIMARAKKHKKCD
jgi:hypothetical protein